MKAKRIKIIKDWPKPKLVRNIPVFLGFANFYWQFIQGFSRIAAPLTSMLKTTRSLDKPALNRNDGSKSASNRNNNSKLAFEKNDGNNEVNRFSVGENSVEHTKKSRKTSKSRKLSKSGKSKSEKTSKSQNLAKSGKKLLKSGNSTYFDVMEVGPKFLTSDARTAFNRLWLVFTKALIF